MSGLNALAGIYCFEPWILFVVFAPPEPDHNTILAR